MHYRNGREAKNGDKAVCNTYNGPVTGVLYDAVAGNDSCNGQLAPVHGGFPIVANLSECLHLDDFKTVLTDEFMSSVIDTSTTEEK